MEKDTLRKLMISRIRRYENKEESSRLIVSALRDRYVYRDAETILAFSPLLSEPDISPILDDERVLLPYIENGEMKFSKGRAERSYLGVKLVRNGKEEEYSNAVILVPLLAYDDKLYRLGRGGGYYDRYIRKNRERIYSIGLAFRVSYVDYVPHSKYDERLDEIIAF